MLYSLFPLGAAPMRPPSFASYAHGKRERNILAPAFSSELQSAAKYVPRVTRLILIIMNGLTTHYF